jgi:uncharacterized membrane protein
MMLHKSITARSCAALAFTALASFSMVGKASAQAANTAPAQAYTDLIFCNNTAKKVYIAIVYYEVRTQKWMQAAWYNRNPGECKSNGKYRSGLTYYHAYNEGRTSTWPAAAKVDKTFCVPAGRVERVQLGGTCATGERNVGFHGINATGASYKFTLN